MLTTKCPPREHLEAFAKGWLADEEIESVTDHLEACDDCENTVAFFDDDSDTFIEQMREPIEHAEFADEPDFQQAVAAIESFDRDASSTTQPGQLREYQLLDKLGEGGMGTVYRALHNRMQRVVALKILPAHRRDTSSVSRFEREIQAVGKLDHPNIVRAYDAGEDEDMHYLVMELVEGIDLHRLTRQCGQLPVADACELVRQAALGLQHAHEHGLVHRDIKPSNLMLCRTDEWSDKDVQPTVKILDLGLALLQSDEHRHEMTNTGQVMGTLDYMAPEQASDSHAVDIRADIYSLGCTLYKLLAAKSPFSGPSYDTPVKKVMAHAKEAARSMKDIREDVPSRLSDLVDRMLSKDPADRPQSPAELAAVLEPFCVGHDLSAMAEQVDEMPGHDRRIASANEIPILLKDGVVHLPGKGGDVADGHRQGGLCLALGSTSMTVALALLILAVAGLSKAYRLREMGFPSFDGFAAMISESIGWVGYAVPAFVCGLVLLIVSYRQRGQLDSSITPLDERRRPTGVGFFLTAIATIMLITTGALAVFLLNTPHGKLEVRTNDEHVKVEVSHDGKIKIIDTSTKDTIELAAGEYGIRVVGEEKKRFRVDTDRFTIRRDEKVVVRVTLLPSDGDLPTEQEKTPMFGGKPLSYWVAQLKDRDPAFRQKAIEAIVSFGNAGAPPLIKMLEDEDAYARYQAVRGLTELAPTGKQAVPRLIELLDDPKDKTFGKHPDDRTYQQLLICLARFGPHAKSAQDVLVKELKDKDRRKYCALAAWCLGFIEADRDRIVEPLIKLLASEIDDERRAAAYVLGQSKSHAEKITQALAKTLVTPSLNLGSLVNAAPPVSQADELLSGDGMTHVRESHAQTMVLDTLVSFGELADEAILELSRNKTVEARGYAVQALRQRGTSAAINRMVAMRGESSDETAYITSSINSTLYMVAGTNTVAFLQAARTWNADTRANIANALAPNFIDYSGDGTFGVGATPRPRPEQLAKDPKLTIDVLTRAITHIKRFGDHHSIAAAATLALIGSDDAKEALKKLQEHESKKVRDAVAKVLGVASKEPPPKPKPAPDTGIGASMQKRLDKALATVKTALAEAKKLEATDRRRAVEVLMPAMLEAELLDSFDVEDGTELYIKVDAELNRIDPTGNVRRLITSERTAAEIERYVTEALIDIRQSFESTDRTLMKYRTQMQRFRSLAKERVVDPNVKRDIDAHLLATDRKVYGAVTWVKENPVVIESFGLPRERGKIFLAGPTDLNYWLGGMAILSKREFKDNSETDIWIGTSNDKDPKKPYENLTWRKHTTVLSASNPKLMHSGDRVSMPGTIEKLNRNDVRLHVVDFTKPDDSYESNTHHVDLKIDESIVSDLSVEAVLHAQASTRLDEKRWHQSLFYRLGMTEGKKKDRWQLMHVGRSNDGGLSEPRPVTNPIRWPSMKLQPPAVAMSDRHILCFAMNEQDQAVLFRTRDGGKTWNEERVALDDGVKAKKRIPLVMWDRGFFELVYATVSDDIETLGEQFQLFKAQSFNEGRAWQEIRRITEPFEAGLEDWLYAVRAVGGGNEAFVLYKPDADSMRLLATVDEGRTWQDISLADQFDGDLEICAMKMHRDGVMFAGHVYDRSRDENQAQLVFQRISMGRLRLKDDASATANETKVRIALSEPAGAIIRQPNEKGKFDSKPIGFPGEIRLEPGTTSRLKLMGIPKRVGKRFYPTIEIPELSNPSKKFYQAAEISISFTQSDIDRAQYGSLVTKVVVWPRDGGPIQTLVKSTKLNTFFAPDSFEFEGSATGNVEELAEPKEAADDDVPKGDPKNAKVAKDNWLDPGLDPIAEGRKLGTVLAIVRLGNVDFEKRIHLAGKKTPRNGIEWHEPMMPIRIPHTEPRQVHVVKESHDMNRNVTIWEVRFNAPVETPVKASVEFPDLSRRAKTYFAHCALPLRLTANDVETIRDGDLFTKKKSITHVFFIPNPEFTELSLAGVDTLVSTRLDPGVDPIAEAKRQGEIVAVLHLSPGPKVKFEKGEKFLIDPKKTGAY